MTTYDYLWLLMTTYDFLWLLMTTFANLWQLMTAYNSFWQPLTAYDSLWQLLTSFDSFWQLLTAYHSKWKPMTAFDSNSVWAAHENFAVLVDTKRSCWPIRVCKSMRWSYEVGLGVVFEQSAANQHLTRVGLHQLLCISCAWLNS